MADLLKGLFGGSSAAPKPSEDADFADFASPSPVSIPSASSSISSSPTPGIPSPSGRQVPYTKWYRVWERTSPSDFYAEAVGLPFIILAVFVHVWGTRKNKRKAKTWLQAHAQPIANEFSFVGFGGYNRASPVNEANDQALQLWLQNPGSSVPDELLKEKTANEFTTYASGRQNVAFVDFKVTLKKRYNPVYLLMENVLSLFFESIAAPAEKLEAVSYVFDGKEKDYVPPSNRAEDENEKPRSTGNSSYDGFVWALVNKNSMKKLRDDRYDVSLTATKEHPKLPQWATVMSESAEVTEMMLTKELISAAEQAGDLFEYLIVTDQPVDKPTKLDETIPKKRINLSLRLPPSSSSPSSYNPTLALFTTFLRLPDHLAGAAHLRPEILRKIKATREEQIGRLKRVAEAEEEEARKSKSDKIKKDERDRKMRGMTAEEQRKFLEREEAKKRKKGEKRVTRKG